MKKNVYKVVFIDDTSMEIWALNADQAKILAQADRIKRGEIYEVKECNYICHLVA